MEATINSQILFDYNGIPYEAIIINQSEKAFFIEFGANIGFNSDRRHKTWIPKSVLETMKFKSCNAEYISIKKWFIKNIFSKK